MKRELKHLSGYLPYELGFLNIYSNFQLTINGLREDQVYNHGHGYMDFEHIKPILLPLSYLTKEIEVNGEKFVPILELYKMRTQHMTDKIDKYYIENDTAILKLQEITTPDGRLSFVSYFEIDIDFENIHFSICTETVDNMKDEIVEERFGFIGNDFNMLQKLYEWHFDIYGLIENGLAIDKNTLK